MKITMKYFTCEGRFSRLYNYHVKFLMYFTGVKPLNLPYYLYRGLAKKSNKLYHKISDHQTSLLHPTLIKIIVLYHLSQKNITWGTFVQSNFFFPSTSKTTSQSTPSTSSKHMEIGSSSRNVVKRTPRPEVTQTYQRGRKLVFTPHIVEGAKLTLVEPTEQGSPSLHEAPLQDEEPFHLDTDMVDLKVNEGHKTIEQVIMEKFSKIKELRESLCKAHFMISFLEEENKKLKVNQLLLSKHKVDARKEDVKGKEVVDTNDSDEHQVHVT